MAESTKKSDKDKHAKKSKRTTKKSEPLKHAVDVPQIGPEELILESELGRGCFGVVYKGRCRGKIVAIKKLHSNLGDEVVKDFQKEVDIWTHLRHPNIVSFMGACTAPGELAIVTEFMAQGDVNQLIHSPNSKVSVFQKLKMAADVSQGMMWLHQSKPPIIHRDLKPSNLLIDENLNVKICDFGLSAFQIIEELKSDTSPGTPLWMSPEVLSGEIVTPKADVYSFAIVLWELMTGNSPFEHHEDYGEFLKAVIDQEERPPIPPELDSKIAQLIKDCWQPDPLKRPSFDEILPRVYALSIDIAIPNDPLGVQLWTDNFFGQSQCTWNKFLQPFYKKMGEPLGRDREIITSYKILLHLLTKDSASDKTLIVELETFGRFLAWFGPLSSKGGFLDRLVTQCQEKWFHGLIERTQAEALLAQFKKKGSFLVRLSSTEPHTSPFTVSRLTMAKTVEHQRIFRSKDGSGLYTHIKNPKDKTTQKIEVAGGIDQLIKKIAKPLDLKEPCLGSQFQQKFFAESGAEGGDYNEPPEDNED